MRFFTSLFALLISFIGSTTIQAQLQVSYDETASVAASSLEDGLYVIKAKFKNSPEGWLWMNNSQGKFVAAPTTTNLTYVWCVEHSEDGSTFCLKNALNSHYLKCGNNANLTATTDKSQASYFTTVSDYTINNGVSKLADNAFAMYVGNAITSGSPQFLHANGVSGDGSGVQPTALTLSSWETNVQSPNVGGSTVGQFAFYKVTLKNVVKTPAVSENCTYYLQNSAGTFLTIQSSQAIGTNATSIDGVRTYYLKRRSDGYLEIYSGDNKLTCSGNLWYVSKDRVSSNITQDQWQLQEISDIPGAYTLYNVYKKYVQAGNNGGNVPFSTAINGNSTWFLIPANNAAVAANQLTIKVNSGDEVHGNIATFSASYPVVLPDNYTAYYATYNAEGNYLQMNAIEGNVIPENTGVIVKGDANATLSMQPSLAVVTAVSADNKLASVGDNAYTFTDSDTNIYLLGKSKTSGELSFIRMNTSGTQTIGAHKAYLNLSDVSTESLNAIQMHFGGVIESVNTIVKNDKEDADAPYYDLSGRRVLAPQHGIYIKGGKKVIIK